MNVYEALDRGANQLSRSGASDCRLDCEYLLSHVVGRDRIWLLLNRLQTLNETQAVRYSALVARRSQGTPVQYLIESCEFFGLELRVKSGVYVPKRETECLVEAALAFFNAPRNPDLTWGESQSEAIIHEIGTGSGAIAIAVARHAPRTQIWAGDISAFAISLARSNAQLNGVARSINFLRGDLQSPLPGVPDLVIANLPYIRESEGPDLPPEVRVQPRSSLMSGASGECHIVRLLRGLRIKSGGRVFLEIGSDQAEGVEEPLRRHGKIPVLGDLAGFGGSGPRCGDRSGLIPPRITLISNRMF